MPAWLVHAPTLALTVALVFVPGLVSFWFLGMRRLTLAAAAPLFGVAATALIALVFGALGVPWSPLTWLAAMTLLVATAAVLARWLGGRMGTERTSPGWLLVLAIGLGIALTSWRLIDYIHEPAAISQTNDAVFHLNAVRYILETGNASSLHVNSVIDGTGFYPAAWHAFASLIVMITGVSIPVAANLLTLVIGAVVWPLGIAWLTRVVTSSDAIAAYAVVLSGGLQTFPLLMFQWGVLYPNALSTALLPAAIATVVSLPLWRPAAGRIAASVRAGLLVLVALAALLLAQPSGVLPWSAITAVWLTSWLAGHRNVLGTLRTIVLSGVLWGVVVTAWLYLSSGTSGSHWSYFRGRGEALLDVLLNGQLRIPYAFAISALMLLGLFLAVRRTSIRWFAIAWAGVSLLYVLAATAGRDIVRVNLLGAWYADPYRIAALAPLVVIPLAALGIDALVKWSARLAGRSESRVAGTSVGLGFAVVLVAAIVAFRPVAMPAITEGTFDRESRYLMTEDSYLSPDELALLQRLDQLVPEGGRVLGNPSTGSGFGYVLSGVDVYPRTWATPRTDAWMVLSERLRDAQTDPAVCEAVAEYDDPRFVLDFGPGEAGAGRYVAPGMTRFNGQPGFEKIDAVGEASLWRITACSG
ncbi:hypothetical protein JF531_04690 [Microbacterium esteraromaticum]|uniref:DUF6541 family protein n=1 Tax=Microbacterium esteraromaticum TaxID=57043 RepID=UPI001A8D1638|nr:DUF6541 family protein [Microbacterium esteraromaticum]MBN8423813.1 hypothetical protein [Microbacterium esteraromaticum]